VLACIICPLQDHFTRFRNPSLDFPEKILAWRRERLRILEALKRGDGQLAERLVQVGRRFYYIVVIKEHNFDIL
jgi:DNA-binding GntR family transcriptional regulator